MSEDDGPWSDSDDQEWSDNTPDGITSEDCVIEDVSYSCPSCGNDSYGNIHEDCYGTCAICGYYFEWHYLKTYDDKNSIYDGEQLCKQCTRDHKVLQDNPPDIKEPEVECVDWSKQGVVPNTEA